jgi:transcriptional regulator with GAF, ATPase, and Fis domain
MLTEFDRHASAQGESSAEDSGSTAGRDELAVLLSDLARTLEREDDTDAMLATMVHEAIAAVPGVQEASISVVTARRHVESQAASGELPALVDHLQEETGQGPCLDAAYDHHTVRVEDMGKEERWPKFAAAAREAGAGSMLCFQLYVEGDNLGALNLYASEPGAFDDESEHVGLLFASHAAVAFAGIQKHDQMTQVIATGDLIGQAKGRLIERFDIGGDRAFMLLIRVCQTQHMKLRDVAEQLVFSGNLTGVP